MIGARRSGWGADWGFVGEIPSGIRQIGSDAAAAEIVASAYSKGEPVPPIVLTCGDLARTLGIDGASSSASSSQGMRVITDLGSVSVDGHHQWFVAHLVARRSWWKGRLLIITNASFLGDWNIAPRAHPGDGRLDVLDACPPLSVRWAARRRLRSGTHVPHSAIAQRRITKAQFNLDPALDVYLDGRKLSDRKSSRVSRIDISVIPSALEVWVPVQVTGD